MCSHYHHSHVCLCVYLVCDGEAVQSTVDSLLSPSVPPAWVHAGDCCPQNRTLWWCYTLSYPSAAWSRWDAHDQYVALHYKHCTCTCIKHAHEHCICRSYIWEPNLLLQSQSVNQPWFVVDDLKHSQAFCLYQQHLKWIKLQIRATT